MNKVLSDKRFGTKLRVTENRCVLFDSFTYIYIYIYIYIATGEKNRETILSSLQACFVITNSSGDFILLMKSPDE